MVASTTDLAELAEKFGFDGSLGNIPACIQATMQYIDVHTGLLGDYHDGIVQIGENGRIIQWYARGRYFSNHDRLVIWVQQQPELIMPVIGVRTHPETGEPVPYMEIHERDRWVRE